MKRWVLAVLVAAVMLVLATTSVAVADTNAYVNAQVTMSYVSVRVAENGTLDYGDMALSQYKASKDIAGGGFTRLENDGTLSSDWMMYASAPTNGSNTLTWSAFGPGSNQPVWYAWRYDIPSGGVNNTPVGVLDGVTGLAMGTDVAPAGFDRFDFQLFTPTSVSGGGTYSWQGTVVATQH
jgi:hypothetical protein